MTSFSLTPLRQKLLGLALAPSERRLQQVFTLLLTLYQQGTPYQNLTQFLVKERQGAAHFFDTLPLSIAQKRVHRPLYAEACSVAHGWLQQVVKGRVSAPAPTWQLNTEPFVPEVLGWCDGSLKRGMGQIGFVLKKPNGRTLARVTHAVYARDAMEAELTALLRLLELAVALGYPTMRVSTDAQGVLPVLEGKGVLRFSVLEADLSAAAQCFTHLQVIKVHRLFNYEADRLAACNFIRN